MPWITIQLALADGARIKDKEEREKEKKPKKMTNEEMRDFFNNRNALRRKH